MAMHQGFGKGLLRRVALREGWPRSSGGRALESLPGPRPSERQGAGAHAEAIGQGERYKARDAFRRCWEPSAAGATCGYRWNMPSTSSGSSRRILPQR